MLTHAQITAIREAMHAMANAFQRQALGIDAMEDFQAAQDRARDAFEGRTKDDGEVTT